MLGFFIIYFLLEVNYPGSKIYIGFVDIELLQLLSPLILLVVGALLYGSIMFGAMSVEPVIKNGGLYGR
jgi:hypothetical protein